MNCLKCGREISEDEVFCLECQLDAQRYPVEPGSAVYLPRRPAAEAVKKQPRRRVVPLEEQLNIMRRRLRNTVIALILVVALAAAMLYPAVSFFFRKHHRPGQNYSAITPATSAPTEAAE